MNSGAINGHSQCLRWAPREGHQEERSLIWATHVVNVKAAFFPGGVQVSPAREHGRSGGPGPGDLGFGIWEAMASSSSPGSLQPRLGLVAGVRPVAGPGGVVRERSQVG